MKLPVFIETVNYFFCKTIFLKENSYKLMNDLHTPEREQITELVILLQSVSKIKRFSLLIML